MRFMIVSPDAQELLDRLERIQALASKLAKVQGDAIEQQALSERISHEIQAARGMLTIYAHNDPRR
jgi:hypothetical protein